MLELDKIRATIVKGLKEYLGIPIIRANDTGDSPKYPYGSYTITTPLKNHAGTWGKYADGKERIPAIQVWSLSFQSDNYGQILELSVKAHDWFSHVGSEYLNSNGIIVQSVTGISNRDNLITIEYENRNGFDVTLWLLNETGDGNVGYIEDASLEWIK